MKILLNILGVAVCFGSMASADRVTVNNKPNQFYVAINGAKDGVADEFYDLLVKAGAPFQQGIEGHRYYSGSFSASSLFLGRPIFNATINSPGPLKAVTDPVKTTVYLYGPLAEELVMIMQKAGITPWRIPGLTRYSNGKNIVCGSGDLTKFINCSVTAPN